MRAVALCLLALVVKRVHGQSGGGGRHAARHLVPLHAFAIGVITSARTYDRINATVKAYWVPGMSGAGEPNSGVALVKYG
jgi:hypothetical protein